MITPRYTPTCTDKCMEGLGALSEKYQVPVQSHLSEGLDEIEWVKELKPGLSCYGEAYDMYGMLGSKQHTVMAHVVHPNAAEYELLKHRNVLVAHCPQSNTNAAGGVAPILDMVRDGIQVGLGTDMAGGYTLRCHSGQQAPLGLHRAQRRALCQEALHDHRKRLLSGHQGRRRFLRQGGQL